jgi:hypothetical protein
MDGVYEPKNLPDPRCTGPKLTAAARAHGLGGDGSYYFTYTMFPGGPGWMVSVTQPKSGVVMLNDRGCEPF